MTEAIARETKSQGDQVARHSRLLNRGGSTGRRRHDLDQETHPEASTSGSHHANQEENKPTLRKQGPASRDLGSRNRNRNISQSQCFQTSEGRHHRWNGEWPKNGGKARQRRQVRKAVPSHNLQENSQPRFCQLDTTVARRNRPVKSRRGLRQAPRGRSKRRLAQARRNQHAKESLEEARSDRKEIPADAQGIKGTRVAAARLSRRRGGQATTHTRA